MALEINFQCLRLGSLLEINCQVGVMWFLPLVTLLKYIFFEVMIGYVFK